MIASRTRQFCNGCFSCKSPCGKEQKEAKFSKTVTKVLDEHSDLFEKLSDKPLKKEKKMAKKKKDLYGYKVTINKTIIESVKEVMNDEWIHSDYSDWSEVCSNKFDKIRREDEFPDISSPFDIHESEVLHLVWVEYTEGNSFGSSVRGASEAIGLFKSIHPARELAKAIKDHPDDHDDWQPKKFYCKTKDGQVFSHSHPSWTGFFEKLEEVHIEKIELNHGNKKNVK